MSRNDGFAGESSIARVTRFSVMFEPSARREIPQRLAPDLAVGVHLGLADDLAEVAVRVAARADVRGAGAPDAGAPTGQSSGCVRIRSAFSPTYRPTRTSPDALRFGLEAVVRGSPSRTSRSRPRPSRPAAGRSASRRRWRPRRAGSRARACTRGTRRRPRRRRWTRGTGRGCRCRLWNRYICMIGGVPSGGVDMLALSTWPPSGKPPTELAPSSGCACTASCPRPWPAGSAAGSCRRGREADRRGAQVIVEVVDVVEDLGRILAPVGAPGVRQVGFHEQRNCGTHGGPPAGVSNGWNGKFQLWSLAALTSSLDCAMLSSLTSV